MYDQMSTFELYGPIDEIEAVFQLLTTKADGDILKLDLEGKSFSIETDFIVLPIQRFYNHIWCHELHTYDSTIGHLIDYIACKYKSLSGFFRSYDRINDYSMSLYKIHNGEMRHVVKPEYIEDKGIYINAGVPYVSK